MKDYSIPANVDAGAADANNPVKLAYGGKPSLDYMLPIAAQRLNYDADTGAFRWRHNVGTKIKAEQRAGRIDRNGYVIIGINGKLVLAHRIAYYITHGHCPPLIDHINSNKADNRAINLREATPTQNQHNAGARRDSGTGIRGVCIWCDKEGRQWYRAQIKEDRKLKCLGNFRDPVVAWLHRAAAAQRIHGTFMRESSASGHPPELIEFIGDHIRERSARQLSPRPLSAP